MGCTRGATVLLAYDPRTATAWLRDLVDAHPSLGLSLCPTHAERTSVPMGWERVDERRPAWQSYEVDSPFEPDFTSRPDADPDPIDIVGRHELDRLKAPAAKDAPVAPQTRPEVPSAAPPLAAEVRSRLREEEERSFFNGPADAVLPAPAAKPEPAPLRVPAPSASKRSAEESTDFGDETFPIDDWLDVDDDDDFDEIFGLTATDEPVEGEPFDATEADEGPAPAAKEQATRERRDETPAEPAPADRPAAKQPRPSQRPMTDDRIRDDEAEISFEDIFPPKVNQPEEPASAPRPSDPTPGVETFSERDRQQRSLFGDGETFGDGDTPVDRRIIGGGSHGKPVAQADSLTQSPTNPMSVQAPASDTASVSPESEILEQSPAEQSPAEQSRPAPQTPAPAVGPPRLDARPTYMPTRTGTTSKLQVESTSPLLGRAFGFVQRD